MKKLEVRDYSERAIVVIGETKEFKDSLKQLGGRYNKFLSCGEGWVFSRRWIDDVQKFVNEVNGKAATPRKSKKAAAKARLEEETAKNAAKAEAVAKKKAEIAAAEAAKAAEEVAPAEEAAAETAE